MSKLYFQEKSKLVPWKLRKAGSVWCGGARETREPHVTIGRTVSKSETIKNFPPLKILTVHFDKIMNTNQEDCLRNSEITWKLSIHKNNAQFVSVFFFRKSLNFIFWWIISHPVLHFTFGIFLSPERNKPSKVLITLE